MPDDLVARHSELCRQAGDRDRYSVEERHRATLEAARVAAQLSGRAAATDAERADHWSGISDEHRWAAARLQESGRPVLRCVVRGRVVPGWAPVELIEVHGVLAPPSVPLLRNTVLEVAEGQPDAIVLDLDTAEVADTLSPTVFATLGRQLTDRDVDLILAAPHAGVPDPLRQAPPLFARIFASRSQALAAARHPPARRRVSRQLVAEPQAPRIGRQLVMDVCARWRLDDLTVRAAIVVDEFVQNAVMHAGGIVDLCITVRRQVLRVEVSDHSTQLPALRGPNGGPAAGRGLQLVDDVASRWGATSTSWGKTVWAELMIGAAPVAGGR